MCWEWDNVAVKLLCSLLQERGSLSKSGCAVVPVLLPELTELPFQLLASCLVSRPWWFFMKLQNITLE